MKIKKIALASAATLAVLALASCGGKNAAATNGGKDYTINVDADFTPEASMDVSDIDLDTATDEELYDKFWQTYEDEVLAGEAASSNAERFYHYAKAEAYILDQALYLPMTTEGGTYGLTRVAPHSAPNAKWGVTNQRLNTLAIAQEMVKSSDRETMKNHWKTSNEACNLGSYYSWSDGSHKTSYDPVKELTDLGYTVKRSYNSALSNFPETFNPAATYRSTDTDHIASLYDTLVEYDNAGNIVPGLAESWTRNADSTVYTFKIREGVKWIDSTGAARVDLTANDFYFGIKTVLELGNTSSLLEPIKGFDMAKLNDGTLTMDDLGITVEDDYTIKFELNRSIDYFLSYLTYVTYMPINQAYYESTAETKDGETTYSYGTNKDKTLYCGPYYVSELTKDSAFKLKKNTLYWDAANTTIDDVTYTYDDFSNSQDVFSKFQDGTYDGIGLTNDRIKLAKAAGIFDDYSYVSDTTAGSYFGGFNLNRRAYSTEGYEVDSTKTDEEKALTKRAMLNTNFRRALLTSIDKEKFNATMVGADVALYSLRNTYVPYDFVTLTEDTNGYSTGTLYGDMVLGEFNKTTWGKYITSLKDGYNAFYSTDLASKFIDTAFEELGLSDDQVVCVDYPYMSYRPDITARANALKASVETATDGKIQINLVACSDVYAFYYSNYYVDDASELNYDIDISSGWNPDFADPSSYINTFKRNGDMVRLNGINQHTKSEK